MPRKAIIIGAGPAGLTAAYELLKRTDIKPIILEKSGDIGGISKTINYKGNRMDMGPHRFFSKSDRVMNWWMNIMPLEKTAGENITINYQNKQREINTADVQTNGKNDKVMLVISRLTRIYFLRKFFAYPIKLSIDTLRTLGLIRTIKIMFSFLWVRLFPRKPEKSLEDFIINKFGRQLYLLFFKDYTEKVWGVPCNEISAEWGAQRIKGVSLGKAIGEAIKSLRKKKSGDIGQKGTETSLIEQFLYPKYGPGSLWEEVARQVEEMGGKIYLNQNVSNIYFEDGRIVGVNTINSETQQTGAWEGDYFFSSMPVQELIAGMDASVSSQVPKDVKEVAAGLQYRDFINVGILLKQLSKPVGKGQYEKLELKDNWIYIQERDVKVGRLMIYNNWGDGMINDPKNTWIGMEYFCNKTDDFWALPDEAIQRIAIEELEKMELANVDDVLDITVRRMEKTYPAYFGTYNQFDTVKEYVSQFENLFLVGRNGMHKYNNADHSMLTAMVSVDNICKGVTSKEDIWAINTEQEYHEVKKETTETEVAPTEEKEVQPIAAFESTPSFKDFLFKNKQNRKYLIWAAIFIVLEFIVFKYLYPFASFIHGDSFVYIRAAANNEDINTHMIGYSRFLRLFSVFSSSDTALVTFQYLLAHAGGLFFLFTLFYFHNINKAIRITLLSFMVVNPMFLYMANMVSSDCLFMSLSLVWFSLLLWILHKPLNQVILWHTIVLFLAFTVRYNALVYPAIVFITFFLAKQLPLKKKLIGIAAPLLLCGLFVLYTGNKYKQLTGTWQYSPFSGWQLANNAMYTYRYVDSADRKPVPAKFRPLDNMIRSYFDSTRNIYKYPIEGIMANTAYMWTPELPLYQYRETVLRDSTASELKQWASLAPLYKEYGSYIISKYPLYFIQYFIWPNTSKYYAPPSEFLEFYNHGKDSVHPIATEWFRYKTNHVTSIQKKAPAYALEIYPVLTGIMNVVLLCCLACLIALRGFRTNKRLTTTVVLVLIIWLLNAVFTITSSPAAIRLQAFPILLETTFALVLLDWMWKLAISAEIKKNKASGIPKDADSLPAKAFA